MSLLWQAQVGENGWATSKVILITSHCHRVFLCHSRLSYVFSDKFEWAAAVNPKSFLKTWLNSAEHASHCNYTSFLGGLHEEVHCIPSNYKTFLGGCPRRNCPSAHALASHQKLFSSTAIKGVKTIKCYGPWKCLTSRYTQTVPKTTWQQSSNMKCLKSFKIDLKVDFDSEKINSRRQRQESLRSSAFRPLPLDSPAFPWSPPIIAICYFSKMTLITFFQQITYKILLLVLFSKEVALNR